MRVCRHQSVTRSRAARGFTLVELLVTLAIVAVLVVIGFLLAKRSMQRAEMARLTSNLRTLTVGVSSYMAEHGKLADMIFGVQYPAREICKGMDGVGAGYCGPEWRVRGTSSWKSYGDRTDAVWGWAVADAQLITNQGTIAGVEDPTNRPVLFYGRPSGSSYQDNLGHASVITRMQAFSKDHLNGSTLVGYLDGRVASFGNVPSWNNPDEAWDRIWVPKSRR